MRRQLHADRVRAGDGAGVAQQLVGMGHRRARLTHEVPLPIAIGFVVRVRHGRRHLGRSDVDRVRMPATRRVPVALDEHRRRAESRAVGVGWGAREWLS